jgi:hypothetical protein
MSVNCNTLITIAYTVYEWTEAFENKKNGVVFMTGCACLFRTVILCSHLLEKLTESYFC